MEIFKGNKQNKNNNKREKKKTQIKVFFCREVQRRALIIG